MPIDKIRALAHVAQREQATAYLVTSGKVGVTARKEMATATPQVFLVDGEWLWKWIGRGRGQNKEEIFLPGHATPAASAKSGKANTAGCLTVLVACAVALAATLLCIQILTRLARSGRDCPAAALWVGRGAVQVLDERPRLRRLVRKSTASP